MGPAEGQSQPDEPNGVDRDDVEDLLAAVLGPDGEVTGAGIGMGGWHLDVQVTADAGGSAHVVERLAVALVEQGLGWVVLRSEGQDSGKAARTLLE